MMIAGADGRITYRPRSEILDAISTAGAPTVPGMCYHSKEENSGGNIMKLKFLGVAGFAVASALSGSVQAADITAFVSNALKSTVEEHAVTLDKGSGVTLKATYGTTEPLKIRIEKGEAVDFALLGEEAIDDLLKKGRLVAGSRVAVARAGLGVAIRQGAPKLDLSSTEAFKRAMLAAKSISYNER